MPSGKYSQLKRKSMQTVNPHSENFNQFENARLFARLQKKFTPKPYWKQYQILRVVVLLASYLFNALSAATAAALVYFFLFEMIGSVVASGVLTAAGLAILEIAKRETTGRFFNALLQFGRFSAGLAAIVVLLAALSVASSYFGAQRLVIEFTPPAQQISGDSLTAARDQITRIDKEISETRRQTWNGKITAPAQRTIERLNAQKETALAELVRQQQRIDSKNDAAETTHQTTTTAAAAQFGAFTLVCELLFILAAFYLEYYDYRSFAEHTKRPAEQTTGDAKNGSLAGELLNGSARPAAVANLRADDYRLTKNVQPGNTRSCEHCGKGYEYRHTKQKYCCDACRIESWQNRTGKEIRRRSFT
jgi:hypothetical protein